MPLDYESLAREPDMSETEKVHPQKKLSRTRRCMSPYYTVPFFVVIVHTLLLVFSWIFLVMTFTKPVPLPVKDAIRAQKHMQTVTLVVIFVSTAIAYVASNLYAGAIGYALARLLTTEVSLFTIVAGFRAVKPTWIKDSKRPLWTIGSVLFVILLGAQTGAYTTILNPKQITIKSNMVGYELDLKSPDFQTLMATNAELVTADTFVRVLSVAESAGGTAVSTRFQLPSILNFNHYSYLNSTHGVLPVAVQPVDSKILSEWGNMMPINTQVDLKTATPAGPVFPVGFLMTQQGFTALVSCQQQVLDTTTVPSLTPRLSQQSLFNKTVYLAQLESLCPGSSSSDLSDPVLTSANIDVFYAVNCGVNENGGGRRSWNLIMTGSGLYKQINTTVCNVIPQIKTVTIDYNDNAQLFNSTVPNFMNGTEPLDGEDAPWLGEFVMDVFMKALNGGQSTTGNAMGNTILTYLTALPNGTDVLSDVLAQYVRGVIELSGTFLRTLYTQEGNKLYPGGASVIPPSMRVATNGTYWATTIGWHQSRSALAALIAPTIVSLTSILIVLVTIVRSWRIKEPEANRYFNPGDVLHIVSAASAGGMQKQFPPFDELKVDKVRDVMIKLAPVGDEGRLGFIDDD